MLKWPFYKAFAGCVPAKFIAAIQETCGFKNANALKNLFKRRYNMSMRAYRAK